jgi:Na+-transporting methylmalonyl-CoA/oxaloacetate decarboxylase gamma subunit
LALLRSYSSKIIASDSLRFRFRSFNTSRIFLREGVGAMARRERHAKKYQRHNEKKTKKKTTIAKPARANTQSKVIQAAAVRARQPHKKKA